MAGSVRSVDDLLRQAGEARESGALDKAAKFCRLVLKSHPRQADALHLLAIIALDSGNFAEADRQFRAMLAVNPRSHQALLNHSIALVEIDRHDEALAQCEKALQLGCDRSRGLALRGSALRMLKRGEEALASYDEAIALAPRNPEIHFNRGNALQDIERHDEALASYDAAIALAPQYVAAINNRGTTLRELGRYEEALAGYAQVLAIDPRSWQGHNNRGNLFTATGRAGEAAAAFRQALALAPRNPECHYNLGNALQELGQYAEAMECYGKALSIEPRHLQAHLNRAGAARRLKLYRRALSDYAAARRIDPAAPYLDGYAADTRALCCDWSQAADEQALADAVRRGERACPPFAFLALSGDDADHHACARTWVQDKFARVTKLPPPPPRRDGPIRIAYLSPDFRNHAVSHLIARLFEIHDRGRFEVIGASFGPQTGDPMRRRLVAAFDAFIDISTMSDAAAADLLRARDVDIAVDLAGFTEHARTGILARRPAGVQVNYLGYPGTMGADFIDYIIADPWTLPDAAAPFFSEKVVHLPDTYQANDDTVAVPSAPPSRADAGLPEHGFVFCCFNNAYKIRPYVFDVWMRLLREVPRSVLWLLSDSRETMDNLRREAQSRGVAPERLMFAPRVTLAEHLARHRLADVFLDTLPYNAHTTASDALRAGVPVVTCAGNSFASRVAASLLHAVGLPELVTQSLADYEALALRLVRDEPLLARTRATLAANVRTQPLFDADRFRRHIEAAYVTMHERHLAGEPPTAFAVAAS